MSFADHLDDDELTTVCSALRWAPDVWLSHLSNCADCRATLRDAAALHDAFAPVEPSPMLLAAAERTVRAAARAERASERRGTAGLITRRGLAAIATGTLAATTAFAALVSFAAINPLTAGVLIPVAALAIGVGVTSTRPDSLRRVPGAGVLWL